MLHAKFQDHRISGSGEEDFRGIYHIWAWRPSWSCDLDHLYKLSPPPPFPRRLHMNLALIGQVHSEEMFEHHERTPTITTSTDAGAWVYYKSDGSGELTIFYYVLWLPGRAKNSL